MLADDSGIEVAALRGAPGVLTARWAEDRHVEKLLAALDGVDDRRAQYVCELVALSPDGEEVVGGGVLRGVIALAVLQARRASGSTRSSSRSAKSAPSPSSATRGRRRTRTGRSPRGRCATSSVVSRGRSSSRDRQGGAARSPRREAESSWSPRTRGRTSNARRRSSSTGRSPGEAHRVSRSS